MLRLSYQRRLPVHPLKQISCTSILTNANSEVRNNMGTCCVLEESHRLRDEPSFGLRSDVILGLAQMLAFLLTRPSIKCSFCSDAMLTIARFWRQPKVFVASWIDNL